MCRKLLIAAFVVLWGASVAFGQSMEFPVRLANTEWSGHETLGGYGNLRFVFTNTGVTMYDKDGATPGTWQQNGNNVTMWFYNGTVVYSGAIQGQTCSYRTSFLKNNDDFYEFSVGVACRGATMGGTAHNGDGATWNWNMSLPPIGINVSGWYEEAPFGFFIPLDSNGSGGGSAVLGRENPDPARLRWEMRLAQ